MGMHSTVRKGGMQTGKGFLFELSGGDISLDFVNTVDLRPTPEPKELIPRFVDFLSWSLQSKILTAAQEKALRKMAKAKAATAEDVRKQAVEARECLFQIFSHMAEEKKIPEEVIHKWNAIASDSQAHYEMIPGEKRFSWRLRSAPLKFEAPLWIVTHSAIQLLTSPNSLRIRKCEGENCNWVFLDLSKRGNRRWCDMTVCGNRAKARAFYARKKQRKI